jgi:dihydropyrimidinase
MVGGDGASVTEMQTPFGGGKTHALLSLYHLIKSPKESLAVPGVKEALGDVSIPGNARVLVFDGQEYGAEPWAKENGAKICIAHTSTGQTAEINKRERVTGNETFFLETCPHYLCLTQDKLKGPEGALFTMNPPLRSPEDNKRLWRAVLDGEIDILSTDHCPYLRQYKLGKDYLTVPCGVDGVQTRMIYLFSEGVIKRNLPIIDFVKMTSANAAKFYNLYPQKGIIRRGSDADLTIIDPDARWTWDASSIAGATDYSVLDGLELTGKIVCVVKGGKAVMTDAAVTAEKGGGRFLSTVKA